MSVFKKVCSAGVLIAVSAAATSAMAQTDEPPARGPAAFAVYDQNGDGYIGEKEFNAVHEKRMEMREVEGRPMRRMNAPLFSDYDTDGDGKLTPAELTAGQTAQMQKPREDAGMGMAQGRSMAGMGGMNMPSFTAYDLDGNGTITRAEFDEARSKRMQERAEAGMQMRNAANAPAFDEIDANGDGKITTDEFAAHQEAQLKERRDARMESGSGRPMGGGMGMARNMPAFSAYDLDGNGKITAKEFDEARSKRMQERAEAGMQMRNAGNAPTFAEIDINGDGEITVEEFRAHQSAQMKSKAPQ